MRSPLVALVLALALTLGACGAATVSLPRGPYALAYADAKAVLAVWIYRLNEGCHSGKLSASVCEDAKTTIAGLSLLDEQARAAILQSDKEPDWATIAKVLEIALSLALKAAA